MIVLKISTLLIVITISLVGGYLAGRYFSIVDYFKNKKKNNRDNS